MCYKNSYAWSVRRSKLYGRRETAGPRTLHSRRSSASKHCHHTLPRDSQSVEAMKLLAILTFYITVYATLCVAGTKCRDVKCTIVADTQQNNLDNGKAPGLDQNDKYSCCACGGATYHITFIGKWTKATYPRHFPGIMARWSSLIGASHSKDYILWKYGGMASPGVTRVSEWGSVDKLVQEMKHQGDDLFRSGQNIILRKKNYDMIYVI